MEKERTGNGTPEGYKPKSLEESKRDLEKQYDIDDLRCKLSEMD